MEMGIVLLTFKAIVGLLLGMLQREKLLDIDALVSTYVPEIAQSACHGATIRQLLDMQVAIKLYTDQERAYWTAMNWDPALADETSKDLHAFLEA